MPDDRAPAPHTHHLRVLRTARFFTLGGDHEPPSAIWFVLHGYGQLAGQFVRYFGALASPTDLVVAPEALNRFYLIGVDKPASERPVGATWMTREDRASEIADYVEYLDALHDDVVTRAAASGATQPTVNVIGFSQGAATATRWLTHGRTRVSRLILWGGLLPPDTDLSRGAAMLHGARLTLVLGKRDQYVDAAMLAAERARLEAARIAYDVIEFEGGHAVSRAVFARLRDGSGADAPSDASGR